MFIINESIFFSSDFIKWAPKSFRTLGLLGLRGESNPVLLPPRPTPNPQMWKLRSPRSHTAGAEPTTGLVLNLYARCLLTHIRL